MLTLVIKQKAWQKRDKVKNCSDFFIKDIFKAKNGGRSIIMMQLDQETERGHQPPYKLHVGMLSGINLSIYPKEKTHYLAYALQFGLKLPTLSTMRRSQARNQRKSGQTKAAEARGNPQVVSYGRRAKRTFVLPNRYGDTSTGIRQLMRRVNRRGRGKQTKMIAQKNSNKAVAYRSKRAIPGRQPISLPKELVKKEKTVLSPKTIINAFRTRSPEWIQLRAEREKFRQEIEKYRSSLAMEPEKQVPQYFRKKKANQKRRRKEKHELIQANRQALRELFGQVIFQRGWPISRKEIKLALGIKEEDHDKVVSVKQFMRMAEQDAANRREAESVSKNRNSKSRPKSRSKRT